MSASFFNQIGKSLSSRRVLRVLAKGALLALAIWFVVTALYRFVSPPMTPLVAIRALERTFKGKSMVEGWAWSPIVKLPRHVKAAVVAAEDARFMEHWGIDIGSLGTVLSRRSKWPRGASTITMQTVKNLFLWPGRSYVRKAVELALSPVAQVVWGKRRTLELYLNVAEWGDGIYGIESASRYYFRKSATQLTSSEAAALAAVLPSPRTVSPLRLSAVARRRYARIMREMHGTAVP